MATPDALENQLYAHLTELEADPILSLDERLFDSCLTFLAVQLPQQDPRKLANLVNRLSQLLLRVQQDPAPLIRLLSKLIEPFTFTDIISLQQPADLVRGLDKGALPFNLLVLKIVRKAARSAKDAALLAGLPGVVLALVRLWLSTSDMGVSEMSSAVLLDLLKIDKESSGVPVHGVGDEQLHAGGQGLVWRRLFGDPEVYSQFYSLPSFTSGEEILNKREKSVAQARLLSFLPQVGVLDWTYIVRSHHADVEATYGLKADQGLLHFACLHLVDHKDDVLMHMSLIQFFSDLLLTNRAAPSSSSNPNQSAPLDFLIEHHLHERTMSFWLQPDSSHQDPVNLAFLYGPSAHYISTYTSHYPTHFLHSRHYRPILQRLCKTLFDIPIAQWGRDEAPKHDLSLLASLPRIALVPQSFLGTGILASPLFSIPPYVPNEDALHTLAKIFAGPKASLTFPQSTTTTPVMTTLPSESAAAHLLFDLYNKRNTTFFRDLITHADTIALPGNALAALSLLNAIITATWDADLKTADLPQELIIAYADAATRLLPPSTAASSMDMLLRPPGRDVVLPYLLGAPKTFSNLVGGRGDTEIAAYRVAVARWDVVRAFERALEGYTPRSGGSGEDVGLEGVREAVRVRVMEGAWGAVGGPEVGGRIATLEM